MKFTLFWKMCTKHEFLEKLYKKRELHEKDAHSTQAEKVHKPAKRYINVHQNEKFERLFSTIDRVIFKYLEHN